MVKKQELVGCLIPLRAHLFYHPRREWLNLAIGLREYVTLRHKGVKRFLRVARLFLGLLPSASRIRHEKEKARPKGL